MEATAIGCLKLLDLRQSRLRGVPGWSNYLRAFRGNYSCMDQYMHVCKDRFLLVSLDLQLHVVSKFSVLEGVPPALACVSEV